MNKKYLLALPVIALILMGAGCDVASTPAGSYQSDTQTTRANQASAATSVPIPTIKNSVERQNIARRATTFDVQNKVSYIYLVSYGKVMAFYTVSGKVSSLNSYMTPEEQLVYGDGFPCDQRHADSPDCYPVSAPDIDGAYGENANGIFFFTTDGAYVEWKGDYMMSDAPLKLTTQPELVREIK